VSSRSAAFGRLEGANAGAIGGMASTSINSARSPASRLANTTYDEFKGSFLVIQRSALIGNSLTQIADYAALRSFVAANEKHVESLQESSILTLFNDREKNIEPMEHISDWDLALVNALYSTSANISAMRQRVAMVNKIERDIETTQQSAD